MRGGGHKKGKGLVALAAGAAFVAVLIASALTAVPASAQLLPPGFFKQEPTAGAKAEVEADMLAYNSATTEVSAEGGVILRYDGYVLTAERVTFNQTTNDTYAEGNVVIRGPDGTVYSGDRIRLTDRLKHAFIESLTLTTPEGALVRATDVEYDEVLVTTLTNAHYSPCGLCVDEKGRRIGWKVNASKMVYDEDRALVFLEGASVELLGIPVMWLPWLVVPDPSQPRAQGFRLPKVSASGKAGVRLDIPYFVPVTDDIDLVFTPSLMTRQGLLMQAEWTHRLPIGTYDIKASGIYQLDPSVFSFPEAKGPWRGALQTTGTFRPFDDWVVGWSYTAFSDPAYLIDYELQSNKNVVNEVYATHVTEDTYLDVRARRYNLLGDVTMASQNQQATSLPLIEMAKYVDLGDYGQIELSGEVLGVQRGADNFATYGGVPYVFGFEEQKVHATFQGSWQNPYILPGGVVATPYLGMRLDAGTYNRSIAALPGPYPTPASGSLLELTPIAALDIRYPLVAVDGLDSHILEPIAQLAYRGSNTTLVGITNDDAQSFVFDDTLLFSYNRFSGTDRQETGLRANVGARYLANYSDGSWLNVIAGQSFHLAGPNAFASVDPAQTGNSTGLGTPASYFVVGGQGSLGGGLVFGAKAQVDTGTFRLARFAAAGALNWDVYTFGSTYTYLPAQPATGTLADQHELSLNVSAPLPFDYWYASAYGSWDIAQNSWLEAGGSVTYDDGYLVTGLFGQINGPTHTSPNAVSWGLRFRLRGPSGEWGL